MKLSIPKEYFYGHPMPPNVYLCNTSKTILGQLPATAISLNAKWNSYAELSFSINREYVDILTGETKVHPLFDKVEAPRNIFLKNYGYFALQDIDAGYSNEDSKSVTAFSLEYSTLGTKYLTNFTINKGTTDSREVMYLANLYGEGYDVTKDPYIEATGPYDAYKSYYIKEYTSADSFVWTQVEIKDTTAYAKYDGSTVEKTLYVLKYQRVQFLNRTNTKLSLLHLILESCPEWQIGTVDATLWHKERSFEESRVAVYDFLTTTVADTFGCVIEFDSLTGLINVYAEADDGITDDNEVDEQWDTNVLISRENLANEISVKYSSDNIKTKLTVSGAEDLNISEVNLDRNSIMNLSFYHSLDWMEPDLFEAYDKYLRALKEAETGLDPDGYKSAIYPMSHSDAVKNWVAANNKYSEIMNAVPAENDTVLVGDKFTKLYCMFTPIDTAFVPTTIQEASPTQSFDALYSDSACKTAIDKSSLSNGATFIVQGYQYSYSSGKFVYRSRVATTTAKTALINKLNIYLVDEDTSANKTDNVLLKLKNANSDIATIRIYDPKRLATESYSQTASYYTRKESASGTVTYTKVIVPNEASFKAYGAGALYTNNYTIQSTVVRSDSGLSDAPSYWSMSNENLSSGATPQSFDEWIKGNLTAEAMGLKDYTVSSIGTMGAYFVLSKNEFTIERDDLVPSKDFLRTYGVNLLKEKQSIYINIFQMQTEAMYSQEKYQCVASPEPPAGIIAEGTRWFDTDANPPVLYKRVGQQWVAVQNDANEADLKNYQRYIDNYKKLQAVQEVLLEKEREAAYCLNGYKVEDRKITSIDASLEANMHRAAETYLNELSKSTGKKYTITKKTFNNNLPLYTFTISPDAQRSVFAVYLIGTAPYVAYADSQGVYQMIRDYIRSKTELSSFFTDDQWVRLSPFIREDEFSDQNFLLTGYESEEERVKICKELMDAATKELNRLCQPSLEFSMTMSNILALPEFAPLVDKFQLGNFIRVLIRDGYTKRARLLEVNINFDDLSSLSCTFGNLITAKSEVDRHADLLAQAVSAGKQVATAASSWQRAVDKSNKLEEAISDGLKDATLQIGRASGQAISWDENGFFCRKLIDGTTDQYENEQMAIINNKLVFTNDGWQTSKAVLGQFKVDTNGDGVAEENYGLLADAVISGYIDGATIRGGSLEIGGREGDKGKFVVHEDGSVEILGPDATTPVYATTDAVDLVAQARQYHIELDYTGSTIFTEPGQSCTITCRIFSWDNEIKNVPSGTVYKWFRTSNTDDGAWNEAHIYTDRNTITITNDDVEKNAQFYCQCILDDTKIT